MKKSTTETTSKPATLRLHKDSLKSLRVRTAMQTGVHPTMSMHAMGCPPGPPPPRQG